MTDNKIILMIDLYKSDYQLLHFFLNFRIWLLGDERFKSWMSLLIGANWSIKLFAIIHNLLSQEIVSIVHDWIIEPMED